ncbi:putative delta-60 repeat protein [Bradyrhizobium diazoefficiens]
MLSDFSMSFDGSRLLSSSGNFYTAAPPALAITEVSGDNYVNPTEDLVPVKVTGTSDAIGETVHITSPNGSTATALVQADGTWTTFIGATKVAEGVRNFTADVSNDFGIHGTATKSVDFDYTPPALVLEAVAGDNIVARRELSAITINGTSDAYGHQVSLSIDHKFIGNALVTATGEWNFVYDGTNLADGQHEIEFSVFDDAGNKNDRSIFFDKVTPHDAAPTFFVGGGYVVTPVGEPYDSAGTSLAIAVDGRIVVGGWTNSGGELQSFAAARYEADGHLDATFGDGGIVIAAAGTEYDSALQTDGKTILAGYIGPSFGLQRLNDDGTLDTSFGSGGTVTTSFNSALSSAILSVVVDGTKIIAVGTAFYGTQSNYADFALARYLADGSLDPTFGSGGIVTTDFGSPAGVGETATSVKVQTDGKIVVGGLSALSDNESVFALARYNSDGTLDSSFGTNGKVQTAINLSGDFLSEIQLLPDGKILAAGSTYDGSQFKLALVRYTSSGALDTSFDGDGKVVTDLIDAKSQAATDVVVQPDGKILVGGYTLISDLDPNAFKEFAVARYNANGTLDTTFGDAGVVVTEIRDSSVAVSVRLQADGKIVVAGDSFDEGTFSRAFAVARYNADGSQDPEFGGTNSLGNTVSYTEGGAAIVLDATAKIFDSDLAALNGGAGNYGGASVTLARSGGANAEDVFGASGNLAFAGSNVMVAGVTVGSFTQSGGQLVITFADGATQAQVNGVLDAITYANSSHDFAAGTTTPIQIAWSFSDGNNGRQGIGGTMTTAGITTVDVIADNNLGVTLAFDSGTPDDGITNDGTLNVTGLTQGATWSYSTDGGTTFTPGTGASFTLTGDGPENVLVREIAPGNVISTATLAFTLDTSAAKPALALATDSGTDGDGITKDGTVNVSGLEAGAAGQYSVDGGATFVTGTGSSFMLTGDGPKAVLVHQIDTGGNISGDTSFAFTLDTSAAAAPGLTLATDSGRFGDDGVTNVGTVNVSGLEAGATWEYSDNGDPFVAGIGSSFTVTGLGSGDGQHHVVVHQTDAAGNRSADTSFTFKFDTFVQAPLLSLPDSGILGDGITKAGKFTVFGLETDATWEYSVNGGPYVAGTGSGITSFTVTGDGPKTVLVRQTDLAGNTSAPTSFSFTLDTSAAAPVLVLATDSGPAGEGITNVGTVNVSGLEAGATWEYSINATGFVKGTGSSIIVTGDGPRIVQVRQTDAAGNISDPATLSFTLDTLAAAPAVALATDSGNNGSDGITKFGTVNVSGLETGATWQYSVNGSAFATGAGSSFILSGDGPKTVLVHQTDTAGNVSTDTSLTVALDTQAPDTTITAKPPALINATSASFSWSGTDTADGSGVVSYQYQLDNGSWTSTNSTSQTFTTLSDGSHSLKVVAIDAAGNIDATPASYGWTVDTKAPTPLITSELINKNGSATLGGTSEANSTIQIFDNDTQIGMTTTTASGAWTFTTGKESNVVHTFSVTGTDAAGNVGTGTGAAIYGSNGNDTISGTSGNDLITGAAGADNLAGGLGNDVFAYAATGDSKQAKASFDTIADFVSGSDKLDFSTIAGLNTNNQNVTINIMNGGPTPQSIAAHTIDVVIIGNNAIIYANESSKSETISNGHEDMQINLTGVTTMSASDFILFH